MLKKRRVPTCVFTHLCEPVSLDCNRIKLLAVALRITGVDADGQIPQLNIMPLSRQPQEKSLCRTERHTITGHQTDAFAGRRFLLARASVVISAVMMSETKNMTKLMAKYRFKHQVHGIPFSIGIAGMTEHCDYIDRSILVGTHAGVVLRKSKLPTRILHLGHPLEGSEMLLLASPGRIVNRRVFIANEHVRRVIPPTTDVGLRPHILPFQHPVLPFGRHVHAGHVGTVVGHNLLVGRLAATGNQNHDANHP